MRTTNPMTLPVISAAAARRFTSLILAFLCMASAAFPVVAQDPNQPQQNGRLQGTSEQPVSRPIPERTIGLEPGKVVRWTMRDAILAALEKSVDIELERETVKLAQYDIFQAQGFYDPLTNSSWAYTKSIRPNVFQFSGAGRDESSIQNDTLDYNFGLSKNFERYGSLIDFNFNNSRVASSANDLLTPQYTPVMTVNVTQPLFKNFTIDANRRALKIARKNLDLSDALFRQRAIEIISQVQQAYWDLALAIRNEEVARAAVKLAETQLNNNKRQVEVGTLAPIDVVSAAASLETNRQNVFAVMNQVAQAENVLKTFTVSGPGDDLWNARIEPVESFEIKPFDLPLGDAIKLAQDNRPEVKQFALRKEMNKIDIDFFRNQAKPQIDLIGSYSSNGVGGTPVTQTTNNCSGGIPADFDSNGRPTTCLFPSGSIDVGGQQALSVIRRDFVTGTAVPVSPNFVGGYGTALRNLFNNDFRTWSVGVRFSFPLRNRTAQANLGRAREQEHQLDLQTRRQLQNIEVEVRNAVQSVETSRMRSEAARAARIYAEQQLEGENKRFAAGLVGTFFVLQRQDDLTRAQFTELSALADYNKAVATLQRVIATTLSSNNIEVKSDVPPMK